MTRVNVYEQIDYDADWMRHDEKPALLGWFDPDKAERFDQGKSWDGNNMVGVITGSQWIDEYLYRTAQGKWVLNKDAHRYHSGPDTYEFINGEQARDWLLRSECNNEAIERLFGEVPEEEDRRPGRPEVGNAVNVRLGDLLAPLDSYASENGHTRAEAIRVLLGEALAAGQPYTVTYLDLQTRAREVGSRHATLGAAVEALREEQDYDAENNGLPSRQPRVEHNGRPVDVETVTG